MKKILTYLSLSILLTNASMAQSWFDGQCDLENEVSNESLASSKENNTLNILLNQEGDLLINTLKSNGLSEIKFKELVYNFIMNPAKDKTKASSPKQAIVSIGTYNKENSYVIMLNYIREVYLYEWDKQAQEKYNSSYQDLSCKNRKKIRDKIPYQVIELDKGKTKPKMIMGVPSFKGDVIDN